MLNKAKDKGCPFLSFCRCMIVLCFLLERELFTCERDRERERERQRACYISVKKSKENTN